MLALIRFLRYNVYLATKRKVKMQTTLQARAILRAAAKCNNVQVTGTWTDVPKNSASNLAKRYIVLCLKATTADSLRATLDEAQKQSTSKVTLTCVSDYKIYATAYLRCAADKL